MQEHRKKPTDSANGVESVCVSSVLTPQLDDTVYPRVTVPKRAPELSVDVYRFLAAVTVLMQNVEGWDGTLHGLGPWLSFNLPLVVMGCALDYRSRVAHTGPKNCSNSVWESSQRILFPALVFSGLVWFLGPFISPQMTRLECLDYLRMSGFLWYVRSCFVVYLFAPLVHQIHVRIKSHARYFVFFCIPALVLFELWLQWIWLYSPLTEGAKIWLFRKIYSWCCFPVYFAILYRIPDLKRSLYWFWWIVMVVCLVFLTLYHVAKGAPAHPHHYRQPTSITYGLYGMIFSMGFYACLPQITKCIYFMNLDDVASFVSSHTIWFFMYLTLYRRFFTHGYPSIVVFYALFLMVYTTTRIQAFVVRCLTVRISSGTIAKHVRTTFGE